LPQGLNLLVCATAASIKEKFMTNTLHRTFVDRLNDGFIATLLRLGVKIGTASLLTVRGRKSGQPHTVPVLVMEQDGQRWLVAPYGVVQWVRNIRAAGTAMLTHGRHSETIAVTELSAWEAAPVLKQYLALQRAADIQKNFDATKDSPVEAFEREAARHPVFSITTVE
jgi:deazaflavin-dependent oxidoreductase (nitroreductase family)